MNKLDILFDKIRKKISYGEITSSFNQIIDLTLDTEDIIQYKKTSLLIELIEADPQKELADTMLVRLDELYQILEQKMQHNDENMLSVSNLTKRYNNSRFTLGPISFDIKQGEVIGLVGENGNGKTTLLRSLSRELRPSEGSINFHFPYNSNYDLRTKLVFIPQRPLSWRGSLLDNLRFTAVSYGIKDKENELYVDLIIARMGLYKFREYSWKNLSSGYKMRFELARSLLRKPQILLIDEPLANLDILAQQLVLDDLRDLASSLFRPLAIVLSSQQLYEVEKNSDAVIFLKDGKPFNSDKPKNNQAEKLDEFLVEFETSMTIEQLHNAFVNQGLQKLQINGGTYVASFEPTMTQYNFLKTVLEKNIPISYFRNITNSTRRFFLS